MSETIVLKQPPRFRTSYNKDHPVVTELNSEKTGCGSTWCNGECGNPALVYEHGGNEYKVHSSMVAVGAVLQPFRVNWYGDKILLETDVEPSDLFKMLWI